ncbi:MAG: LAGLIDADG family homing endonuclease [Candidatus Omnitrophica bacterium]|nr:LAGLIDADG family homing endonuclease [Candidatus Omnitrophota bacterium]
MPQKRKELNIKGKKLWYLVGLITSDGNLSPDGRHIDITSSDYEFLQRVINLIGIKNKIGIKYGKDKLKSFHVQIANKNFYEFLLAIGLTPKKSLTIGAVKVAREFFPDFLRGLIDGDGSIRSWKHPTNFSEQWSLRIYSGSRKFLEWLDKKIQKYLEVYGKIHRNDKRNAIYVLKFGKMAAREVLKSCYYKNNFSLERKNKLAQECICSRMGWQKSKTVLMSIHDAGVLETQTART